METVDRNSEDRAFFERQALVAALRAARVGVWEWDVVDGQYRVCPAAGTILGFQRADLSCGLTLDALVGRVHPDDQAFFRRQVASAADGGGPFLARCRTLGEAGHVRVVMCQGFVELDDSGAVAHARGIVMDASPDRADDTDAASLEPESGIERLARVALETWHTLGRLDYQEREDIEPVIRALLILLGRKLAAKASGPSDVLKTVKRSLSS